MIARRVRSRFTPSNSSEVHRRFESILRKASQKRDTPPPAPTTQKSQSPWRLSRSA